MRFEEKVSGGLSVLVDDSNCIAIERELLNGSDYFTVTDVDRLCRALRAAQRFVAGEEEREGRSVLLEIEVSAAEAEALTRWHEDAAKTKVPTLTVGVLDIIGLVEQLAEAAAS